MTMSTRREVLLMMGVLVPVGLYTANDTACRDRLQGKRTVPSAPPVVTRLPGGQSRHLDEPRCCTQDVDPVG